MLFIVMGNSGVAQKINPKFIHEYNSSDVEEYVWHNKDGIHDAVEFSKEWEGYSAVYLHYEDYYVAKEKSGGKDISYIAHRRLKLLDKAAVDQFSEIYIAKKPHGTYNVEIGRLKSFFGVKVIKPNGEETELDYKEIIKDKDGEKLAVSNLEVGDIIDYYIYTNDIVRFDYMFGWYGIIDKFPIHGAYPIKYFDYVLVADREWEVCMTTGGNGYPIEEKVIENDGKFYSFGIHEKDIPTVNSQYWYNPYFSSPYIKMFVKSKLKALETRESKGASTWRISSLEAEQVIDAYKSYFEKDPKAKNEYKALVRHLERTGKGGLRKEEILEEYYYYIRHLYTNKHLFYDRYNGNKLRSLSAKSFTGHMIYALDKLGIPYEIIVVSTKQNGAITDVIDIDETDYLIKANLEKPLYFYRPSPYTRFNDFPASIEGVKGYLVQSPDQKNINVEAEDLPSSPYKDNLSVFKTDIMIDQDDMTILEASTKATYMGHQMDDFKVSLVDWISMVWDENRKYHTEVWGLPEKERGKSKIKLEEFIASEKKQRKESFEALAKSHFALDEVELLDYETFNTGNSTGEKDLQVRFDCQIKGIVKKVGPNYVIQAGKLVGGQITLEEEDMERDVDIFMSFARGYDYTVSIKVPKGFEVKGLENFSYDVDNSTGTFKSSATLEGDLVTITTQKIYKHNYEPAENWGLMKEFLIPASEFPRKELLLKKIKQ